MKYDTQTHPGVKHLCLFVVTNSIGIKFCTARAFAIAAASGSCARGEEETRKWGAAVG